MSASPLTRDGPQTRRCAEPDWTADELTARVDALETSLDDPETRRLQASAAEQAAIRLGRTDLELRARLAWAHTLLRSGETAAGGRAAIAINRQALVGANTHLLSRSHRVLVTFFSLVGDISAQLEHAVRAVELLDDECSDQMRCDHLLALGVALGCAGSYEEARNRFQMAGEIAVAIGEVDLQVSALNNLACIEDCDPDAEAGAPMVAAQRMVDVAAKRSFQLDMPCLETVARAQMGLGRYAEAEGTMLEALDVANGVSHTQGDAEAQCMVTLAEIQRLLGATSRARVTLDRCAEHCDARGLGQIRVQVLRERAELFAAEGDYQEAYEQLKAYQAEGEALDSAEREARSRTLHAVFETEEARRDSLRFREMSVRDPLTGLYNRRFIDERLDTLLLEVASSGLALSIGLVDLDHFKLVNDTLSHGVGDEVLKAVAGLLAGTVSEPAFAARLGGEEFLLVLPGCDAQESLSRCEAARLRIAAHPWADLTGDLAVTGSIGVATVAAGRTTRATLLAEADSNLYEAKRAGRNRVMSAGGPAVDGSGRRRQLRDAI